MGNGIKKYIVITSIFSPTEAVISFSELNGYHLIVVGDRKSPQNWNYNNVEYIAVNEQDNLGFEIAKALPYNHYCRKMLGYLTAIKAGANVIIDTDDDNIPKNNWGFPDFENKYDCIAGDKGFINIYQLYTGQPVWPRGLPLDLIKTDFELQKHILPANCKVGIWQGLADEDPDVDAVYRLTNNQPCYFANRPPVVLAQGSISPFNSQNTIIRRELFSLLYLPTHVTFRFTDILRGLVAQPIMWLYGYQLGFLDATVVQKRNPHDYMKDFISEIPMYEYGDKVIDIVSGAISKDKSIESNLYNAYLALLKRSIVIDKELICLEAWIKDLSNIINAV